MLQKISVETKIFLAIILSTVLLVGTFSLLLGKDTSSVKPGNVVDSSVLVRESSHSVGPKDAKVTIVEFSDFECPACQVAQVAIKQTLSDYKDKVRFVYREFPLPLHQSALLGAKGAEAAGLQEKFWEMHYRLFQEFSNSPTYELTKEKLLVIAKELNLDIEKFSKDIDSDTVAQIISQDQNDGSVAGLTVTPTFFINGTKFDGGLTVEEFKKEIDARLK